VIYQLASNQLKMETSVRGKKNHRLLIAILCLSFLPLSVYAQSAAISKSLRQPAKANHQAAEPQSVTVPLVVEFNRPFVDLEFTRPDGSARKARFWVDTGGGAFILVEPLARELGLELGQEMTEGGDRFAVIKPPATRIGRMSLKLEGAEALVEMGKKTLMPGVAVEGLLPGRVLKRYHVIFDYPGHRFTLAQPNTLKPRGVGLASPIHPRSGFPRLEAMIGGKTYGFLLDTGASFTMISAELLGKWATDHTDWPHVTGAVGAANMGLGPMEASATMMRLPQFNFTSLQLENVAVVSRPKGTFEKYMSEMMTDPIVGAIGGNVWRAFRVEIDYANGATYLEKTGALDVHDLDLVGLTVQAQTEGRFVVVGVAKQNGKETSDGIRAGDKLIKVDKLNVNGAALVKVIDALRGKPGEQRTLVVERDQKPLTIKVPVVRIL
jgi:predicted aspartyl protease